MSSAVTLAAPSVRLYAPMAGREEEMTQEERALVARLRRRDGAAVHALYDRFGPMTFGYLVRALGDRGAAEDVQQQVFLEVWQRGPSYDPRRASLATWIMTIVRSRAIDHLRRRVPEPHDPSGALAVLDTEGAATTDELLDRWWLAAAVAELDPPEAEVLRLRFDRGLSQTEIATALGLPLGTVKSRMARGLERLRARLEADR